MSRTHEGENFLAAESSVSAAPQGTAREPAAARGIAPTPAVPSDRARAVLAAAAHRRLEAWARHALAANGFGAAVATTNGGRP
jgi:hypothetical protein